jgi:hypothetical protein
MTRDPGSVCGVRADCQARYHADRVARHWISGLTLGPKPTPTVVRLYEPISLLFPDGAMPQLSATVPPPCCIVCASPASPPARMGWLKTPEALFVVCGRCADCDDAELERKIAALVTVPAAIAAE